MMGNAFCYYWLNNGVRLQHIFLPLTLFPSLFLLLTCENSFSWEVIFLVFFFWG
uniref:Uncharacterized protein n=1 Tax=Rhizophora mucronata TaxID=61149 RepID=A0A2P2NVU1_RHIMU